LRHLRLPPHLRHWAITNTNLAVVMSGYISISGVSRMKDKRKPVPQHGYYASDGSFLHELYALAVLKQLTPMERKNIINQII
jgi:hypothetical protein